MSDITDYRRPSQICDHYGISRATLYRWLDQAGIKPKKRGRLSFVRLSDVARFIEGAG